MDAIETERLAVGEWHTLAHELGISLADAISTILTEATTKALPEAWQGNFSAERAAAWIDERDAESPTLLILDKASGEAVGFLILFEQPGVDGAGVDLRIGYLFDERVWGQGLASEMVEGLMRWARAQTSIASVTGGVEDSNAASARVLEKNGFVRVGDSPEDTQWCATLRR